MIVQERRGDFPDPFPIGAWNELRVGTDCHVQVRANFYSVPQKLVGENWRRSIRFLDFDRV
jgi:hypothetical protein